eukprot:6177148-Pleurochrysis_carterae.AAC.6
MYVPQALRFIEWALRSALMADGLYAPTNHNGLYVSKFERRICQLELRCVGGGGKKHRVRSFRGQNVESVRCECGS